MTVLDEIVSSEIPRRELGGVACYFSDFERRQTRWALDAKHLLFHLEFNAKELARQYEQESIPRTTRERLKAFRRACLEQMEALSKVLAPLAPEKIPMQDLFQYFTRQGKKDPELLGHFLNLHRDWAWGDAENQATLDAISELVPDGTQLGRVLLPGAGACRLAYDLHRKFSPEATIATEVNPTLFLAAKRIVSGGTLNLYEFPLLPTDAESYAVKRELRAPAGAVKGTFELVLSDFGRPCFNESSFDTIVTSWFIDAVPFDLRVLFPLVNRLLKPNGLWLNLGPTMFKAPFLRFYSVEETLEAVTDSGFACEAKFQRYLPHLHSPASAHHRTERLLGFRARKQNDVPVPTRPPTEGWGEMPAWLVDTKLPVEVGASVKGIVAAHQVSAEILTAVDGKRSIEEIAALVAQKHAIPLETARGFVHKTLGSLIEGAQANPTSAKE